MNKIQQYAASKKKDGRDIRIDSKIQSDKIAIAISIKPDDVSSYFEYKFKGYTIKVESRCWDEYGFKGWVNIFEAHKGNPGKFSGTNSVHVLSDSDFETFMIELKKHISE